MGVRSLASKVLKNAAGLGEDSDGQCLKLQ